MWKPGTLDSNSLIELNHSLYVYLVKVLPNSLLLIDLLFSLIIVLACCWDVSSSSDKQLVFHYPAGHRTTFCDKRFFVACWPQVWVNSFCSFSLYISTSGCWHEFVLVPYLLDMCRCVCIKRHCKRNEKAAAYKNHVHSIPGQHFQWDHCTLVAILAVLVCHGTSN